MSRLRILRSNLAKEFLKKPALSYCIWSALVDLLELLQSFDCTGSHTFDNVFLKEDGDYN